MVRVLKKYNLLDYLTTRKNIDRNSYFYLDQLGERPRRFNDEEDFDFNGIFHNYYWEEIREVLLGGNLQAPIRQQFLFDF